MDRKIIMPRLRYPWPFVPPAHPYYFTEEERGWLETDYMFMSEQAVEKIKGHNLANGASYMAPTTTNIDHLRPIARFFLWLTLYDDYYERWPVEKVAIERDRIVSVILGETPRPDDSGLYWQIAKCRDEFLAFMPYEFIERLARSMYRYTTYGIMEEAPFRFAKRFPSLLRLSYLREYTIAMYPYGDMIEPAMNYVIPKHIAEHPMIMRLRALLCRILAVQNDWYTLEKEMADDQFEVCNHILVLQHHNKISLNEAIQETERIHDAYVNEMDAIQFDLPDFGIHQKDVENYVHHITLNATGLNEWYNTETVRYIPSEFPKDAYKAGRPISKG
ncbi:MAG: terpene synthase family protein [Taibaiella sp.]|jgi:hypothetical protein